MVCLVVNGESTTFLDSVSTLEDIREHYNFKPNTVIMELNGELFKDDDFSTQKIQENDTLEIVHFMGGG